MNYKQSTRGLNRMRPSGFGLSVLSWIRKGTVLPGAVGSLNPWFKDFPLFLVSSPRDRHFTCPAGEAVGKVFVSCKWANEPFPIITGKGLWSASLVRLSVWAGVIMHKIYGVIPQGIYSLVRQTRGIKQDKTKIEQAKQPIKQNKKTATSPPSFLLSPLPCKHIHFIANLFSLTWMFVCLFVCGKGLWISWAGDY